MGESRFARGGGKRTIRGWQGRAVHTGVHPGTCCRGFESAGSTLWRRLGRSGAEQRTTGTVPMIRHDGLSDPTTTVAFRHPRLLPCAEVGEGIAHVMRHEHPVPKPIPRFDPVGLTDREDCRLGQRRYLAGALAGLRTRRTVPVLQSAVDGLGRDTGVGGTGIRNGQVRARGRWRKVVCYNRIHATSP